MLPERKVAILPTIYQSYRPVEEYLDFLERAGCAPAEPGPLGPVDALALGLLLAMAPARPTVVDLALDATAGVSAALCRCQSHVRKVVAVRRPGGAAGWRGALEDYLESCADPSALTPFAEVGADEAAREVRGALPCVVLLPAAGEAPAELGRKAECWLGFGSDVAVVVLSLGEAGRCEHLAALVSAFGAASPYRLSLLRDQAAALHGCRLGVVYGRTHPHLEATLARLRELFTGNFSFLGLTKNACEAAIRAEMADAEWKARQAEEARNAEALRAQYTAEAQRARQLEEALWHLQHGPLAASRQELAQVTGSLAYRLARRLSRARGLLAPEATIRHWVFRKFVRALQVWKAAGLRGVAGAAAKKLVRRRRAA
jgi:hypothetical protein